MFSIDSNPFLKDGVYTNGTNSQSMLKINKTLLAFASLAFVAMGCDNNETEAPKGELSDFALKFVGIRLGSSQSQSDAEGAAINNSFQNMMGLNNGRILGDSTNGGGDGDGDGWTGEDSLLYEDPWVSCAVITYSENADGSTTTIVDYGDDGCEEGYGDYKYFMHGRYESTYKYTSDQNGSQYTDTYFYKTIYDNYGGHYGEDKSYAWGMDGNSSYAGSSSYNYETNEFSGHYSYSDTSLYSYDNTSYNYKSKGRSSYSQLGWTTEESNYEYSDGTNYYSAEVITPLVSKYNCASDGGTSPNDGAYDMAYYVWIPVSGREVISYYQDGVEGTFEINYGNGECDNILYVTENGVTVEVDLGELYYGGVVICGDEPVSSDGKAG